MATDSISQYMGWLNKRVKCIILLKVFAFGNIIIKISSKHWMNFKIMKHIEQEHLPKLDCIRLRAKKMCIERILIKYPVGEYILCMEMIVEFIYVIFLKEKNMIELVR